jgi:iron complex transport system substrate-binding protein
MSGDFFKTFLFVLLFVYGCNGNSVKVETIGSASSPGGVRYAKRFNIKHMDGYSILIIMNPWQGAVNIKQVSYLVEKGKKIPSGIDSSSVIFVPVEKIICMSTTYLSMISALDAEDAIKGISGAGLIFDDTLRKRVQRGEVADVGPDDNLNKELVVKIAPDLIMVYGVGSESAGYLNKIREMGLKVMYNADYLETDPLAKAEWIKVFGALFCKDKEAENIFTTISDEYNSLKSFIRGKNKECPTVLLGLPWKDTWYISPGNSFMNGLINDAGGNYLWKDVSSEISMPFGIENVYMKAQKADYWLNVSSVNNMNEIISVDSRLGDLSVFRKGNLYNNNKLVKPEGGNDYWESGAMKPQVILKDIASILHPGMFPGYEPIYYKKLK